MSNLGENPEHFQADGPETTDWVRQQLARIVDSRQFQRADALTRFLQFVVEETLAGRASELKARSVAFKALRRPKDFDARTDPIVSIQAGRLRRALDRYYKNEGRDDPLLISLPVGRYAPTFSSRETQDTPPSADRLKTPTPPSHESGAPTVAVCQFTNLSEDPEEAYFAAGITQEIVTELTRFQELCVLACQKPPCAMGVGRDRGACRCELGVRFALRGATRRAGEAVRITVQLVDATTDRQVWAESFDRQLSTTELFKVQDEIARSVAGTIADNYGVISRTLAKEVRTQRPEDFSAYDAILHFRFYQIQASDGSRESAIEALEQAVRRDPEYALAWAMLSETTADAFGLRIDTNPDVLAKAKEQARHALLLDPECQHAHWAMAYSHFHCRERQPCIAELEETIALNPNNGYLVGLAAWALALVGEWGRGLEILDRIMDGNPHYPTWFHLAPYLDRYRHGDFEQSLFHAEAFNTKLAWDPLLRAAALGQLGLRDDAHAAVSEFQNCFPDAAADPANYLRGYIFIEELVGEVVDGLRKAGWNDKTADASSSFT